MQLALTTSDASSSTDPTNRRPFGDTTPDRYYGCNNGIQKVLETVPKDPPRTDAPTSSGPGPLDGCLHSPHAHQGLSDLKRNDPNDHRELVQALADGDPTRAVEALMCGLEKKSISPQNAIAIAKDMASAMEQNNMTMDRNAATAFNDAVGQNVL